MLIIIELQGKRNVKLRVFPYVNEMLTKKCKNLCATYCKTDINMLSLRKQLRDMENFESTYLKILTGEYNLSDGIQDTHFPNVIDYVCNKARKLRAVLDDGHSIVLEDYYACMRALVIAKKRLTV